MTNTSKTYQPTKYSTWRMLDQKKGIVLDLDSGRYYSLNHTGSLVWQWLSLRHSVDTIVEHLAKSCAADRQQVATDVAAFVNFLIERKLIEDSKDLAVCPTAESLTAISSADYTKPEVDEHEALKQMVASGSDSGYHSYGGSGNHYWYPS